MKMLNSLRFFLTFLTAACVTLGLPKLAMSEPRHGIAMHGGLKYARGFTHFQYTNPDAPKGGALKIAVQGSFDSLNPLIVKGKSGPGIRANVFESLMSRSFDEPFSLYGLIAKSVETPDDRSSVTFRLNEKARFSDGRSITVDDVVFTHTLLRNHGRPNHRYYYGKVAKVERVGSDGIKFIFKPEGDREMPLIMGLMPILPKHIYDGKDFEKTTLLPPTGSGPYRITKVSPGASGKLIYTRNKNYWGRDLPVNRGRYNFDELRYDYFRDSNAIFEAFKKGLSDMRYETKPSRWSLGYDFPAARQGHVKKQTFSMGIPSGMRAMAFNTRRPQFKDIRVRKAIGLMFNFEWINKTLFHGLYTRTGSFFDRSELSSRGRPASDLEKKMLGTFADKIDPAILAGTWTPPISHISGRDRKNRRKALLLLKEAGYQLRGGVMVHQATSEPLNFEVLSTGRDQERVFLNFSRVLKQIGVKMRVRQVDSAQYQRRKTSFDFDMIETAWLASLSPGNEQSFRWSAASADQNGSYNYAGVKNPAVDAMIKKVVAAHKRPAFTAAVRALDRVLLSGHYVIPLYHLKEQWTAVWNHMRFPAKSTLYGTQLNTWWMDPEKQAAPKP